MKIKQIFVLLFVLSLAGNVAQAQALDGKSNLVCAVTQWQECVAGDGCIDVSPAEIDGVDLLTVDFKKKTLKARDPGNDETTEIAQTIDNDFQIVLQGLDYALSWTMTVHKSDGEMAFTGAREDLVFVAFGRCAED